VNGKLWCAFLSVVGVAIWAQAAMGQDRAEGPREGARGGDNPPSREQALERQVKQLQEQVKHMQEMMAQSQGRPQAAPPAIEREQKARPGAMEQNRPDGNVLEQMRQRRLQELGAAGPRNPSPRGEARGPMAVPEGRDGGRPQGFAQRGGMGRMMPGAPAPWGRGGDGWNQQERSMRGQMPFARGQWCPPMRRQGWGQNARGQGQWGQGRWGQNMQSRPFRGQGQFGGGPANRPMQQGRRGMPMGQGPGFGGGQMGQGPAFGGGQMRQGPAFGGGQMGQRPGFGGGQMGQRPAMGPAAGPQGQQEMAAQVKQLANEVRELMTKFDRLQNQLGRPGERGPDGQGERRPMPNPQPMPNQR